MFAVLAANRDFRLLCGANLISAAGTWTLDVGMIYHVYAVTGSTLASGLMFLVAVVPGVLFGSVAGVFVDRWDRRRTMVVTNVLLAVCLLPLLLVDGPGRTWLIYLVVFALGVVGLFFEPAEAAMVPRVVPAADLIAANALNAQNRQVARLVGAAAGGALAAAGGVVAVAAVDLVSYLVAAVLVALISARARPRDAEPAPPRPAMGHGVRGEWADGIRFCLRHRDLTTLLAFRTVSGLGEGIVVVLFAPLIIGVLRGGSAELGAVFAIQAVGGIVGGLAVAATARRLRPEHLLGYGALTLGLVNLVIALYPLAAPVLWPVLVLTAAIGLPVSALNAGFNTLQQLRTPDAYRGRVFGAITTGFAASMIVGALAAGVLGDAVGIIPVIALQGVIHVLAGPVVLARFRPEHPGSWPVRIHEVGNNV